MKEDHYLVTGCGDAELRVWKITERTESKTPVEHLATILELNSLAETDDPTVSCKKNVINYDNFVNNIRF